MRLVLLLVALALTAGACSTTQPADPGADAEPVPTTPATPDPLDEPIRLEQGETAALPNGAAIRFESVVEDSRCPADVTCVWAGEAKARFTLIESDGAERPVTLTFPGLIMEIPDDPEDLPRAEVGPYALQLLLLQPYPGLKAEAGMPVTATLRVAQP